MSQTYQAQFDAALACTTREEADDWLEREVAEMIARYPQTSSHRAAGVIRSNLGYMSGYYSLDVAQRIYELFDAEHPVFGTPAMRATLTPEDAFAAGVAWAERAAAQITDAMEAEEEC